MSDENQESSRDGWTGTKQAARALEVSERTIRRMVDSGELQGKQVQDGRRRALKVSIDSLGQARDKRVAAGRLRREAAGSTEEPVIGDPEEAAGIAKLIEDLSRRSEDRAAENADLKARLELTSKAQSSIEAERDEARARAEAAERENMRLEAEIKVLLISPDQPKGFWSRFFGL